jgi:hypothetical protein
MNEYSGMEPIPVPTHMRDVLYADFHVQHFGPPQGFSDEEVGTPECLVGHVWPRDGVVLPVIADFWKPTPEQLEMLNAGGVLELRFYTNTLVMHSLTVHENPEEEQS